MFKLNTVTYSGATPITGFFQTLSYKRSFKINDFSSVNAILLLQIDEEYALNSSQYIALLSVYFNSLKAQVFNTKTAYLHCTCICKSLCELSLYYQFWLKT